MFLDIPFIFLMHLKEILFAGAYKVGIFFKLCPGKLNLQL